MTDDAREEAERFRWIQSEKAGHDLGEEAIRQWVSRHWPAFVSGRAIEHLSGQRFWLEMPRAEFGVLVREFPNQQELVREIVTRLTAGADNLTILQWATDNIVPMNEVRNILQRIDINGLRDRFPPPDDADPAHVVHG